jgi:hypothetical protein
MVLDENAENCRTSTFQFLPWELEARSGREKPPMFWFSLELS